MHSLFVIQGLLYVVGICRYLYEVDEFFYVMYLGILKIEAREEVSPPPTPPHIPLGGHRPLVVRHGLTPIWPQHLPPRPAWHPLLSGCPLALGAAGRCCYKRIDSSGKLGRKRCVGLGSCVVVCSRIGVGYGGWVLLRRKRDGLKG